MSFPVSSLNPLSQQKPIIRYAHLCRFWAEQRANRSFARLFGKVAEQPADFFILMLLCRRDLKMARLSLESLASHALAVPNLILAHDESLHSEAVEAVFKDWPAPIQIWDRASVIQYHADSGKDGDWLAKFCERHIFGYKMGACLRATALGRTLYSDADVLWFGDINQLMQRYCQAVVYGSHEAGNSLDEETLQVLPDHGRKLLDGDHCCAGFSIFNRLLPKKIGLKELLEEVVQFKEIGRFSEQTIFNYLVSQCGEVIEPDQVYMYAPKQNVLLQNYWRNHCFALHYPGREKFQFWIDACYT